jgi:hypothetical protein
MKIKITRLGQITTYPAQEVSRVVPLSEMGMRWSVGGTGFGFVSGKPVFVREPSEVGFEPEVHGLAALVVILRDNGDCGLGVLADEVSWMKEE